MEYDAYGAAQAAEAVMAQRLAYEARSAAKQIGGLGSASINRPNLRDQLNELEKTLAETSVRLRAAGDALFGMTPESQLAGEKTLHADDSSITTTVNRILSIARGLMAETNRFQQVG